MLDLNPEKIFVIGIVALVVLGPQRLPGAARTLGRLLGQLRAMTATVQSEVREAIQEPNDAFSSAIAEFRPGSIRQSVRRTITDTLAPPTATAPTTAAVAGDGAAPAAPAPYTGGPGQAPGGAAPNWPGAGWPGTPDDPTLN